MNTLEQTREIDGAIRDEDGRYYVEEGESQRYGYRAHFTGVWVCYTCGHLCDCNETE